jgi:hypothetical protein
MEPLTRHIVQIDRTLAGGSANADDTAKRGGLLELWQQIEEEARARMNK